MTVYIVSGAAVSSKFIIEATEHFCNRKYFYRLIRVMRRASMALRKNLQRGLLSATRNMDSPKLFLIILRIFFFNKLRPSRWVCDSENELKWSFFMFLTGWNCGLFLDCAIQTWDVCVTNRFGWKYPKKIHITCSNAVPFFSATCLKIIQSIFQHH